MKYLAVILLCASLAGCGSILGPSQAERLTASRDECVAYGFTKGTDAYSNCVMQVNEMNTTRDNDRRQAIGRALQAGLQSSNPTTCRTSGNARSSFGTVYGNSTTTCY